MKPDLIARREGALRREARVHGLIMVKASATNPSAHEFGIYRLMRDSQLLHGPLTLYEVERIVGDLAHRPENR